MALCIPSYAHLLASGKMPAIDCGLPQGETGLSQELQEGEGRDAMEQARSWRLLELTEAEQSLLELAMTLLNERKSSEFEAACVHASKHGHEQPRPEDFYLLIVERLAAKVRAAGKPGQVHSE